MKNIFSLESLSDCSIGYLTLNILGKFLQYVCGMYFGLVVENKMKTSGLVVSAVSAILELPPHPFKRRTFSFLKAFAAPAIYALSA